jgi:threonylcarbamoyladenosine tRNA methylthiotransferase MtaB
LKYSVITFGCRVNQSDSLRFEEQFLGDGAEPAPPETADVVVVNTCSVTASADQGARQTIRRIARLNPRARVVVTGCYATREPEHVAALPGVAQIVLNEAKPNLLSLVRGVRLDDVTRIPHDPARSRRDGDGEGSCGAAIEPGVAGRTAYTLGVQTGCAERCSYCIIPTTRGQPQSQSPAHVLDEVERVKRLGFREVALTGVHLGSYGRDLAPQRSLLDLLTALVNRYERAAAGEPEMLFRISSLEPMDCTSALVELVAASRSLAPHFHLPLQHASAAMLDAMGRPYRLGYYAALVDLIRARIPHASIGTDVIVGFPGESDADFEQLAAYLEGSPLTHVHVFPYSDRPGTRASRMGNRPDGPSVKARGARVREIGARLNRRFLDSQVGATHRALTLEDGSIAVTGNYLKVRIGPGLPRNQWVDVRITASQPAPAGYVVRAPVSGPTG